MGRISRLVVAVIGGLVLAGALAVASAQARVVATGAAITGDHSRTEFAITLSQGVTVEVFTLANPYRVILDMPDVAFELSKKAGQSGRGLISAYRYGLFAARKARVVIDTVVPVSIDKAEMTAAAGGAVKLTLSLKAADAISFGAGTGASRAASKPVQSASGPGAEKPRQPRRSGRPVVVIDPGHGGVDPGALGASNIYEKDVVLAVAQEFYEQLKKLDRFEVAMTRSGDVFISLDERLEFSRSRSADLFVSLHADAIADKRFMSQVQGATVYTLSERASDEAARRMAEKENNADAIAGLPSLKDEEEDGVRDILIDLVKRETANFSMDLSKSLVGRLKETTKLSRKPQRAAAFKVLRQTGTPSVLVELGYLSNKDDEKRLNSRPWQQKVAASLASAVSAYFDRRTALAR